MGATPEPSSNQTEGASPPFPIELYGYARQRGGMKMYMIRKQKMSKTKDVDGKVVYAPARAYTIEEYEGTEDFINGTVETAQFRVRGWKYRVMAVDVDASTETIIVRFDWSPTSPTE